MKPIRKIKPWMLRRELILLYYGLRDPRTPKYAKIPAIVGVLYLLSPVDLIPDFIPFVGYVDDLLIFPLLLNLSIRMLPAPVKIDCTQKAIVNRRKMQFAVAMIISLMLGLLVAIFFVVKRWFYPSA